MKDINNFLFLKFFVVCPALDEPEATMAGPTTQPGFVLLQGCSYLQSSHRVRRINISQPVNISLTHSTSR